MSCPAIRRLGLAVPLILSACNSLGGSSDPTLRASAEPMAAASARGPESAASTAGSSAAAEGAQLTLVAKPSEVCMVNNQFMGREQIPVEVEGKTYFGCCEMCKGRLTRDPASRSAKDPVSGNAVDKASAVIAKRPSGELVYFENAANFERYRAL